MHSSSCALIHRVMASVSLFVSLLIGAAGVQAQHCVDYADLGSGPAPLVGAITGFGVPTDIAVTEEMVFVAGSRAVVAFDRLDPLKPGFLGELEVVSTNLLADGTTVYGMGPDGVLQVMDFSDPAVPQVVEHSLVPWAEGGCLTKVGDLLYIVWNYFPYYAQFLVVDVTDPDTPVVLSQEDTYLGWDISISGDNAFVIMNYGESSNGFLGVMDLTDPASPELVAQLELGLAPDSLVLREPYTYVSSASGLRVVDVSDPLDPQVLGPVSGLISTWNLREFESGLVCWGYKYGQDDPGLRVLDISQPEAPVFVGSQETVPACTALVGDGSVVYSVSRGWGLRVHEISDLSSPALEEFTVGLPGLANEVTVTETHAFLGGHNLRIVDITDPSEPELKQTFAMPNFGADLCVQDGTLVWVGSAPDGSGTGQLSVVDVTSPELPVLRGTLPLPDYPLEVGIYQSHAYGASQNSDILITDISDVDSPRLVGSLDIPDAICQSISIIGDLAYVGAGSFLDHEGGLFILDLATDPANPEIIGHLPQSSTVGDFMIDGDVAYMSDHFDRSIMVVDVSDPTAPQLLHREETFPYAWSLYYLNQRLYVGVTGGMRVLDASDPLQMVQVGQVELPGTPREIVRVGSAVGLAVGYDGLFLAGLDCAGIAGVLDHDLPGPYRLGAYPNPFNPLVSVSYRMDRPGQYRLAVHDLKGRLGRVLEEGFAEAGDRNLTWRGIDQSGRDVPSGTYFLRLLGPTGTDVRKVSLIR
jgi:hypothetical protein